MAVIYGKSTTVGVENCVILDPLEKFCYPFGINDWTKLRVAMGISFTSDTVPNRNMDSYPSDTVTANNDRTRLFYGVTRSNLVRNLPRENNEAFVGVRTYGSETYIGFPNVVFDHRNLHGENTYMGVHHPNGSVAGLLRNAAEFGIIGPVSQTAQPSDFGGLLTLYLEVINKGLPNQQLIVKDNVTGFTDTSLNVIKQIMMSRTFNTAGVLDFNASGVPYALPDSFFIYCPIPNVRLRIFSLSAIKET